MSVESRLTPAFTQIGYDIRDIQDGALAVKTKTDNITVTAPVNLDTLRTRVEDLDAAVVLRGGWSAAGSTFPGAGIAQAGDSYIVTAAGTVNSQAFSVNDRIVAIKDNASTTVYATNWLKLDYTDQVISVNGMIGVVTGLAVLSTHIGDPEANYLATYTAARDS